MTRLPQHVELRWLQLVMVDGRAIHKNERLRQVRELRNGFTNNTPRKEVQAILAELRELEQDRYNFLMRRVNG